MSLAKGFLWTGIAVAFTKLVTLINQWVLGFVLEPEDFGVFALAISTTIFISGFLDSGISKLLVREQNKFQEYFRSCFTISIFLGALSTVILAANAVFQDDISVRHAILILAIFVPFMAVSHCYKAILLIDLEFKNISKIEMINSLVYASALVLLAVSGFKALSFVIALGISYITFLILYFKRARKILQNRTIVEKVEPASFFNVFSKLKWIVLATFGLGMALRGDYLIIGQFLSTSDLGQYYFGFMTIANVGLLVAQGINNVLMPSFSKLLEDLNEFQSKFQFLTFCIVNITGLLCLGFIAIAPNIIIFLWEQKWVDAILVSILIAVTFPLRMLSPMGSAALESLGLWKRRAILTWIDALTLMMFAAVGAIYGGLLGCSLTVMLQRGTIGLLQYFQACHELKIRNYGGILLLTALPFFSALMTYYCMLYLDFDPTFHAGNDFLEINTFHLKYKMLPFVASLFVYALGIYFFHRKKIYSLFNQLPFKLR